MPRETKKARTVPRKNKKADTMPREIKKHTQCLKKIRKHTRCSTSWVTVVSRYKMIYTENFSILEHKVYVVDLEDQQFYQAHADPNT